MSDLIDLSIAEAGALLRQRTVSSVELVEATLRRIEETEPAIHAYALVMAEDARAAAQRADRELARGYDRGPLHGIPLGVKDLCFIEGVPTEAGSRAMAGFRPRYTATVVEQLWAAGAVIVGKTVTHEFAFGVNVPPTRTPWLPDGYPGGSSAGSGAAVAARSAFGAIGTDTGGSIREPAALNNLVGLKPTYGRVSRYGVVPLSPTMDHVGPMTRTVLDCALLLGAIAGFDPRDIGSVNEPVPDYPATLEAGVAELTLGIEREHLYEHGTRPEVLRAVDAAVAEYARAGARIVELNIPELALANQIGLTVFLTEASAYGGRYLRERTEDIDPSTRIMLELGELIPGSHYVTAQRARQVFRTAMRRAFDAYGLDALIAPTVPTTTMPIDTVSQPDETGTDPLSAALDAMIPPNITGQPALTVPCGFSTKGLPIGFQLTGRPFAEATLLRLAKAYEREHDWSRRMPAAVTP